MKQVLRAIGIDRRLPRRLLERAAAGRMLLERRLHSWRPTRRLRNRGRILCYHSVGQPLTGVNDVDPFRFRGQIELARSLGFHFVDAEEIVSGRPDPMALAVTFDDAWRSLSTAAIPILSSHGIPSTVFVVTNWSSHDSDFSRREVLGWDDLADMMKMGVRIGSHSLSHPDFSKLDLASARSELEVSREKIEDRLGVLPTSFAIPFGLRKNWNNKLADLALAVGYRQVFSQSENLKPERTIGRSFVTCFDDDAIFEALLFGAFDDWQEWSP